MRIFVISNLYPPMHLGGYELGCADIVDGLRGRGHEVTVLTSRRGFEAPRVEGHVHRCLGFRPDQACGSRVAIFRRTWEDQRTLSRLAAAVKPDLLYAFSFYGISTALLLAAQRLGYPIAFAFSAEWLEPGFRGDSWLSFWHEEAGTPWKRVLKRFARRLMDPVLPTGLLPIDFHHAYFTSWRLRELYCAKGFPVHDAEVIHWGVDLTRFHPPERRGTDNVLRLLFAGRIAPEKGLHTVVEALGLLRERGDATVTLDVAGPTQDASYLATLREGIAASGIANRVGFLGVLSRENMPGVYRSHDALVLPSIWDEPFSIGLLEAMASGLAVVGTTTGGSREILADGMNALTFPPGDAQALATQMGRLTSADLRQRLGRAARRTVEERFTLAAMLERIEAFLHKAAGGRTAFRSRG